MSQKIYLLSNFREADASNMMYSTMREEEGGVLAFSPKYSNGDEMSVAKFSYVDNELFCSKKGMYPGGDVMWETGPDGKRTRKEELPEYSTLDKHFFLLNFVLPFTHPLIKFVVESEKTLLKSVNLLPRFKKEKVELKSSTRFFGTALDFASIDMSVFDSLRYTNAEGSYHLAHGCEYPFEGSVYLPIFNFTMNSVRVKKDNTGKAWLYVNWVVNSFEVGAQKAEKPTLTEEEREDLAMHEYKKSIERMRAIREGVAAVANAPDEFGDESPEALGSPETTPVKLGAKRRLYAPSPPRLERKRSRSSLLTE